MAGLATGFGVQEESKEGSMVVEPFLSLSNTVGFVIRMSVIPGLSVGRDGTGL